MAIPSNLKKKIAAAAEQSGTGWTHLAEALWRARHPADPKQEPASYQELMDITKLSRRACIYHVDVWDRFGHSYDRNKLERLGWTKLAAIADLCDPEDEEEAMVKAESCTVKALPSLLKDAKVLMRRVVVLRFTRTEYQAFRQVLIDHGAKKAKNGVGLKFMEAALMKALKKA